MKHIISFSGGKDSTAMVLKMVELGMPIDEIRFFDAGSWDYPFLTKHIKKLEKYIGIPIIFYKPKFTFDEMFYHPRNSKYPFKAKTGWGWPTFKFRWCTGKKMEVLRVGLVKKDTIMYIGFAADELIRAKGTSIAKGLPCRYPLIELSMTESDCLKYCYSKGFDFFGHYDHFTRLSCWCCPLRSVSDLKNLFKFYPDLWKRFLEMERLVKYPFNSRGRSAFYYNRRFIRESKEKEVPKNGKKLKRLRLMRKRAQG